MKSAFAPAGLYQPAREIVQRLRAAGHEAYIAGGAVRDHLLERPQTDLDIATSATPQEVRALFRRTFAVGESFGVVIVRHRGRSFEVATFREEQDYRDGRHPAVVRFSTAKADVARRDFTINGMLWDPERERVLDWVGGRKDIAARRIRTIGEPAERFREDRLRMLRAVRFAAQLDFGLDRRTLAAIREHAGQLSAVSLERVRQELDKLLAARGAAAGLELLRRSGLWETLRDWLRRETGRQSRGGDCPPGEVDDGAWTIAWSRVRPGGGAALPGLVCLLLDAAGLAPEAWNQEAARAQQGLLEALMRALRGSRGDIEAARAAPRLLAQARDFAHLRLADQLRALRQPAAAWLLPVLRRHPGFSQLPFADMKALVARHKGRWHEPLLLNGRDLMMRGVEPGPPVGRLLDELETLQLEEGLHTREEALAWLETALVAAGEEA